MKEEIFLIFIIDSIIKSIWKQVVINVNWYTIKLFTIHFVILLTTRFLCFLIYFNTTWLCNSSMKYIFKILFDVFYVILKNVSTTFTNKEGSSIFKWKFVTSTFGTGVFYSFLLFEIIWLYRKRNITKSIESKRAKIQSLTKSCWNSTIVIRIELLILLKVKFTISLCSWILLRHIDTLIRIKLLSIFSKRFKIVLFVIIIVIADIVCGNIKVAHFNRKIILFLYIHQYSI